MRQLERHIVLEPQLTPFQINILIGMVKKAHTAMATEARADPVNAASAVASMVEYDEMLKAMDAEKKLYNKLFSEKPHKQ